MDTIYRLRANRSSYDGKKAITQRLLLGMCFLVLVPAMAAAQSADDRRAWGYGFVAPGSTSRDNSATIHFGGGGEGLIHKGLGVGVEIGYLGPARSLGEGFGIFSANGSYHFVKPGSDQKLVPFVTGGYSLGFRTGFANGGNFGGGVQYWASDRFGLRLEFRDHVLSIGNVHFYEFRAGISFR